MKKLNLFKKLLSIIIITYSCSALSFLDKLNPEEKNFIFQNGPRHKFLSFSFICSSYPSNNKKYIISFDKHKKKDEPVLSISSNDESFVLKKSDILDYGREKIETKHGQLSLRYAPSIPPVLTAKLTNDKMKCNFFYISNTDFSKYNQTVDWDINVDSSLRYSNSKKSIRPKKRSPEAHLVTPE